MTTRRFATMSMPARITLPFLPEEQAEQYIDECKTLFDIIDRTFSTFDEDSFISRYGRGEWENEALPSDVAEVLDLCEKVHSVSNGAFDIHRAALESPAFRIQGTNAIEPSGIVKGWAVSKAAAHLRKYDVEDFCIDIAGDLLTSGRSPSSDTWHIALQHPRHPAGAMAVVAIRGAIATSALYARGNHITGESGLLSVTVTGDDIVLADAYATAAFAMGPDGIGWLSRQSGFEFFVVDENGQAHISTGFPEVRAVTEDEAPPV